MEAYDRALALYRELGDVYLTADTLVHIGDTHSAANAVPEARAAWQEALEILVSISHPDAEAVRAQLDAAESRSRQIDA
jgi:hypothetical protein